MIAVYGGLGKDQTEAIQTMLKMLGLDVYSPSDWDDWKADIAGFVLNHPASYIGLIGHSLACGTIAAATGKLDSVKKYLDAIILIEPVWGDKVIYGKTRPLVIYRSQWLGFPRANVYWDDGNSRRLVPGIYISGTNHNTVCQAPITLETIRNLI